MSTAARLKPGNPYAETYRHFLSQTGNHQLTVVHDDGLYRQLRMHDPAMGSMWSWGITTLPWHLATFGDIGSGYMFSREEDMLKFVSSAGRSDGYYSDESPGIDFRYWAEKLVGTGNYERIRCYSHELFVQLVTDHLEYDEELGTAALVGHEGRNSSRKPATASKRTSKTLTRGCATTRRSSAPTPGNGTSRTSTCTSSSPATRSISPSGAGVSTPQQPSRTKDGTHEHPAHTGARQAPHHP